MATTSDKQPVMNAPAQSEFSAVESWSVLSQFITFDDPKLSAVLSKTPSYVILQQSTAELVYAVVVVQSKLISTIRHRPFAMLSPDGHGISPLRAISRKKRA
jgi:hypothetical protein